MHGLALAKLGWLQCVRHFVEAWQSGHLIGNKAVDSPEKRTLVFPSRQYPILPLWTSDCSLTERRTQMDLSGGGGSRCYKVWLNAKTG